jgi:DNA-binding NtrC family response regulator
MPSPHHFLLAEDDYAFRWALAIELQRRGIEVDIAENGAEAIELMDKSGRHCCLLIDLRMPRVSGKEVIAHAATARPETPVLLITAWPDDALGLRHPRMTVLAKPIETANVLARAVQACEVPQHR